MQVLPNSKQLVIVKCTDKWLPSVQPANVIVAMKSAQISSAITSVRMSNTRPAILSALSPVESPEVSNSEE